MCHDAKRGSRDEISSLKFDLSGTTHSQLAPDGVTTNKDDIEDEEEKRDIIDVVGAYVVAPNSRSC